MTSYKFRAGQTVSIVPSRQRQTPKGGFKIVRLLPAEHGVNHYRIKSVLDGHERVVMEGEIA